jgi:hypothetical protein
VINQEEAPFHFKIHLFQGQDSEQFDQREDRTTAQNFLMGFSAE